jgi:hypothetical protein
MDEDQILEKIAALRQEHADIETLLSQALDSKSVDFLLIQRLKKRKLALKDLAERLESGLLPDIIA